MTKKKFLFDEMGQVVYVFKYEQFKGHGKDCSALIITIGETELFGFGRRSSEISGIWYDFLWGTSCKRCQKEIEKEEFWEEHK